MNSLTQKFLSLRSDFEYYASINLKIRAKSGQIVHLKLNRAQRHIHEQIEDQRRRTGKVRAIILKGRQQGSSTYVEGRFYWLTTMANGRQAFILTHEEDATKNLFRMAQRYHEHSELRPSTAASNAKELIFDRLDSGYKVGTAGNKSVGRSSTIQLFHGSEVAFWPHAAEHAKGILQAIPDEPGTEAILESTANGLGNYYHQQWKMAEAGLSEYIAIFVPWYWQDEYTKEPPEGFEPTEEESALVKQYGLTHGQLYWRRNKITDLSVGGADGVSAFKQEYPMNAAEAFQTTGGDGLINPDDVMKARKNRVNGAGPIIVGVDPSRGGDRFAIMRRQGRKAYNPESYTGAQVDKLGKAVSICVRILDDEKPAMMFVDAGGGADLVDRLHELGYKNVKAIAFGSTPLREDKYRNKRAEMWGNGAEWIKDENLPVEVPDDDSVQADFCACPYERDSHDRILLWRKEKIKQEYGFSPDYGDAWALTFAEPVREKRSTPTARPQEGGWMG
jgi:hypothetical protein